MILVYYLLVISLKPETIQQNWWSMQLSMIGNAVGARDRDAGSTSIGWANDSESSSTTTMMTAVTAVTVMTVVTVVTITAVMAPMTVLTTAKTSNNDGTRLGRLQISCFILLDRLWHDALDEHQSQQYQLKKIVWNIFLIAINNIKQCRFDWCSRKTKLMIHKSRTW